MPRRPAGVLCPTRSHRSNSTRSTRSSLLAPAWTRGSSRPPPPGQRQGSRRVRARGRRWPTRPARRTSPVTRRAGGAGRTPRLSRTAPPARPPRSRPAPGRGRPASRPAPGPGLPRTAATHLPASRPGSARGPTRRECSAARYPAIRTERPGVPRRTRPVRDDVPHPARWVPTAHRRAGPHRARCRRPTALDDPRHRTHRSPAASSGSPCPMPRRRTASPGSPHLIRRRPTASRGSRHPTHRRPTASRGSPHPTHRPTAWRVHRHPATSAACRRPTHPRRTAVPGVPRPVHRRKAARCAGRCRTPTARRHAGSLRATRRPRTASRVPPRPAGLRTVPTPVPRAGCCPVRHRPRTAFRALPPRTRGRKRPVAGPCPRTGT